MAKILVAYATVEGQTRKIAGAIADQLSRRRNDVRLLDLTDRSAPDLDPSDFDAAILAAPVHGRLHHAAALDFARRHADALSRLPSALVSVSVHAWSGDPEDVEEARSYVDVFCADAGWLPRAVCYAAGAFRFTRYDFFKRLAVRSLAKERGVAPDKDGDMELTDWRALETFVDGFVKDHVPGG